MNVGYINWRNTDNNPENYVWPVLVTGYQLTPGIVYTSGNSVDSIYLIYQAVGSPNSISQVSYTGNAPINGDAISIPWNGQNGEYLQLIHEHDYKVSPNLTLSTSWVIMQANDSFILLSQAVNNENNNEIEFDPINISYSVPEVKGLKLLLDTRYYFYNTIKNDPIQISQALPGSSKISLLPGFSYHYAINENWSWDSSLIVYGKWYTNNLNG